MFISRWSDQAAKSRDHRDQPEDCAVRHGHCAAEVPHGRRLWLQAGGGGHDGERHAVKMHTRLVHQQQAQASAAQVKTGKILISGKIKVLS